MCRQNCDAVVEVLAVLADFFGVERNLFLPPAEFDRLEEQDRIRREAKARLRRTISSIQREAAERGLTDAELDRLMADES